MKKLCKKVNKAKKLLAFYMSECRQGTCNGK